MSLRELVPQKIEKMAGLLWGRDHSITYPIAETFARFCPGLTIFHFDAHSDCCEEFEGSRLSHAGPFARIMESGLARRLVQVGIRTRTGTNGSSCRDLEWKRWRCSRRPLTKKLKSAETVYLTFDMDVLDQRLLPSSGIASRGNVGARGDRAFTCD